jgi:hypothetical protein
MKQHIPCWGMAFSSAQFLCSRIIQTIAVHSKMIADIKEIL